MIEDFSVKTNHNITKVDAENFDNLETFAKFSEYKYFWSINVMCELYVLAKREYTINVHKYYNDKNSWVKVKVVHTSQDYFSVCSFLDKIYVVGGDFRNMSPINYCFEINTVS